MGSCVYRVLPCLELSRYSGLLSSPIHAKWLHILRPSGLQGKNIALICLTDLTSSRLIDDCCLRLVQLALPFLQSKQVMGGYA